MVVRADFAYPFGQVLHGERNNRIEDGALAQLTSSTSTICLPAQPMLPGPGRRNPHASPMPPVVSLCRNTPQAPAPAPFSQSLLSTGTGDTFTINCSGFDQHGVDPATFKAVFDRKAFPPVTNFSLPTHVNISFTLYAILEVDAQLQLMTSFLWLNMIWYNPFIRWNPKECGGIRKLSMAAENLWLPDIFIEEFMDVDKTPTGLMAYVNSDGRIKYNKPMRVVSICNLDIFYFPFDEQNCTFTFSSFIYTVENMVLGMDKDVQEILKTSQNIIWSKGEWVLQGIHQRMKKTTMGTNEYDKIIFHVAIRRRPRLYIINLLVPSSFLMAIDALSFFLPAESGNRAPFKMTLLLGYNVFLLMMNDLLPASGTPLISVKEPVELVGKVPGPKEAELNGCPGSTRAQQEDEAQKQHLVSLWVQFSRVMDTLLFRLYLLFMATSIITVIVLWNT
nr:5-hydroxytryptamine receptor 3E-like [Vicugna pacos]